MVVVGYGQIIPQSIIDLPAFGILNVHASLLPKYRGRAPVNVKLASSFSRGARRPGVQPPAVESHLLIG